MSRRPARAPVHTLELLVPYQRVALHVIGLAFRDLERPGQAATAREFLAGSAMLRHWSAVAELDAASISACAQRVIASLTRPTPPPGPGDRLHRFGRGD